MRRVLTLLAFIALYLLLTSKSCSSGEDMQGQEREKATVARDSIRSALSAPEVTPEMLRAFEESAKTKLADLSGYSRIAADVTLDSSYRRQARKMIREMFLPGVSPAELSEPVTADAVRVSEPFRNTSDTSFSALLDCGNQVAEIELVLCPVPVGSDTIRTWKLFLGPITAK